MRDQLDQTFSALSDPTRRRILNRLQQGSATILEIAEPFDMSLNAVSKHVKKLEAAGLVSRRVEGRVHRCSLNASPLSEATEWLETYREFWSQALNGLASYVEAGKKTSGKDHG